MGLLFALTRLTDCCLVVVIPLSRNPSFHPVFRIISFFYHTIIVQVFLCCFFDLKKCRSPSQSPSLNFSKNNFVCGNHGHHQNIPKVALKSSVLSPTSSICIGSSAITSLYPKVSCGSDEFDPTVARLPSSIRCAATQNMIGFE